MLRERGIDTLLIAGIKTNACCDCPARDAMMLDVKAMCAVPTKHSRCSASA